MEICTGFMLSAIKYGEQDAVLNCFTKEQGFMSLFVKNIYAKKNKKKPYLSPLNELYFKINHQQKSNVLKTISSVEPCRILDCNEDFRAISIVLFVADFLNIILKNETPSDYLYEQISVLRTKIEAKDHQCHLIFMINFLKNLGASPYISEGDFLNPEEGRFTNAMYNKYFGAEISRIWKGVLQSDMPYDFPIPSSERRNLLESIIIYYQHHIPNFREPESLDVVKQIFD